MLQYQRTSLGSCRGDRRQRLIHLLHQLKERFRERKRNLHMVFVDLEKAYDKVLREVLWLTLMKKEVPIKYIDIIKDMYDGVVTNVRTCGGITSDFSITIGLHQVSVLSLFLFVIVMDERTRIIQDEIPWCMLFADDIVLVDETRAGVHAKLE